MVPTGDASQSSRQKGKEGSAMGVVRSPEGLLTCRLWAWGCHCLSLLCPCEALWEGDVAVPGHSPWPYPPLWSSGGREGMMPKC